MAVSSLKGRFAAGRRFFSELRRRKVIKVAGVYAVVAWLLIQIATQTFPVLHLPEWTATLVVILTILGFPIAVVLAWALEMTPSGVRAEQAKEVGSAATKPIVHAPRPITRSGPLSVHTTTRPAPSSPAPVQDDTQPADPHRETRAAVARLRHDLRTPMNAILGYGSVLAIEAEELGIAPLMPDVQRMQSAAKKLLEQIDHLLPSGPEAADVEVSSIRTRLHEALVGPATELVQRSEALLAKAGTSERASADLERQLGATRTLLAIVQQLASPAVPGQSSPAGARFEQVLGRLGQSVQAMPVTAHAGTLLVVDDDAMNRDLLTRQLVREGYAVFTAASGKEALDKLRLQDFDLVLLDVMMPEMDGIQVLERIQQDPGLHEIPVVMISALDEIDSVARCIDKGAADYLAKPFDPVLLRARVSAPLQIHQLRQDVRRAAEELEQNRTSIDSLMRSVVPPPLSTGLRGGERIACAQYADVTAVVAQLVGLDAVAARQGAAETIERVSATLAAFERCARSQGLELVRATGGGYTAIVGAPEWREDHAERAADFALELLQALRTVAETGREPAEVRIGVNTGPLMTGAAAGDRIVFGMWGEAVSTAEAIASQAPGGTIHISAATRAKLSGKFAFGSPSVSEVAGHGHLRTYPLLGRTPDSLR
jgi:CheY-like chemotaxis protein/signal transduction histidine kinase